MPANFGPVFAALYDALDVLNAVDPGTLSAKKQVLRDNQLDTLQDLLADAHSIALSELTGTGANLANQFKAETAKLDDALATLNNDLARIKAIGDSLSVLTDIATKLMPLLALA